MQNAFDPEVRERRARLLAVRLLRSHADHGQLPAFGLDTLLRHPVSTGLLERPGVHTSQTDWFVWTPKSWENAYFPIERVLDRYFPVSQSWLPPMSGSRVIPCETQTNGIALWGARTQRGFLDFPRFFAREGCGRHCAVLFASEHQSIFAAYTQQSWTSGQVQSAWYSVRD